MTDLLRKYLFGTTASIIPFEGEGTGGGGTPQEQEPDLEDDEGTTDPAGEPDEGGDDGGDDDADDDSGEEIDAQPASESRGRRQYGELRRQNRERQEAADRLARENAELTRQLHEMRRQPSQRAESPEEREARYLRIEDPEQRVLQRWRDEQAARDAHNTNIQFQLIDTTDKTGFQALCARNPVAQKLAGEVERRLADLRRQGQNLPREAVYTYLLGERMRQRMDAKDRKPSASRRRQEARPANGRGDAAVSRASRRAEAGSAADFESRFGDVLI